MKNLFIKGYAFCVLMVTAVAGNAQTFNLHTLEPLTSPAGSTLEWHTAVPVNAGNLLSNVADVNPGLYYAVYKNGTCYSNPSPFKLIRMACGENTVDLYASVDSTDKPANTVVTFHTQKPVSLSTVYAGNAHAVPVGMYYVAYYDTAEDCYTLGTPIRVMPNIVCATVPDFNNTWVNVPVSGKTATNDNVPAGTTYSNPVAVTATGNPTTQVPVMQPNGNYTFEGSLPGVYYYNVSVCSQDIAIGCSKERLTITVLDRSDSAQIPPVANPDYTVTRINVPVTINVVGNDGTANSGGALGTPAQTSNPLNGSVTQNANGTFTYTPNTDFLGTDTFSYNICDTTTLPILCATTLVTIRVIALDTLNNTTVAADDYNQTYGLKPVSGSVVTNDSDPEGDGTLGVSLIGSATSAFGNLALNTNGTYTFTPTVDTFGTVAYTYRKCDDGNPLACALATLYIQLDKAPDYSPTNFIDANNFIGTDSTRDFVVAISNTNNTRNKGKVQFYIPQALPNMTFSVDTTATTANVFSGTAVENVRWHLDVIGDYWILTLKDGVAFNPGSSHFIGFKVKIHPTAPLSQTFSIISTITIGSGGDSNNNNNNNTLNIIKN